VIKWPSNKSCSAKPEPSIQNSVSKIWGCDQRNVRPESYFERNFLYSSFYLKLKNNNFLYTQFEDFFFFFEEERFFDEVPRYEFGRLRQNGPETATRSTGVSTASSLISEDCSPFGSCDRESP
jgi:hypothetical protein